MAIWGFLATIVATFVLGFVQRKLFKAGLTSQDRDVTIVESNAPLPVIYGTAKVPTYRIFAATSSDRKDLYQVLALAHGRVVALKKVYFDGLLAYDADEINNGAKAWIRPGMFIGEIVRQAGNVVRITDIFGNNAPHYLVTGNEVTFTGTFTSLLNGEKFTVTVIDAYSFDVTTASNIGSDKTGSNNVKGLWQRTDAMNGRDWAKLEVDGKLLVIHHDGIDPQTADATMTGVFDGVDGLAVWGANHKGNGIAYIVLKLGADDEVFGGNIPQVSLEIRGSRVDAGAYSENPALCIRDYLQSTVYGLGLADADLDLTSFSDMETYYDELVNVPDDLGGSTTQKRYTMNGVVDTGKSIRENLQEMLTCCRGHLIYFGGKWKLFTRRVTTASTDVLITQADIIGTLRVATPDHKSLANVIRAQFVNPEAHYNVEGFDWPAEGVTNIYKGPDGGEILTKQIDLPFTTNRHMAEQIASIVRHESRSGIQIEFTAMEKAYLLTVGEVFKFTHETPGFNEKLFWVNGIEVNQDRTVKIVGLEYTASAYTHDTQVDADAFPDSDLPSPGIVEPVSDLTLSSGMAFAAIHAQWNYPLDDPYVAGFEVEARITSDDSFGFKPYPLVSREDREAFVTGVGDGQTWAVRVRAVNMAGIKSAWVSASHTVTILAAEFSTTVTAEDLAILYDVVFGTNAETVTVHSSESSASGAPLPPETMEFLVATLTRTGQTSVRVATALNQWRRTKLVAYDKDENRGEVKTYDTNEGAGLGPDGPPTTLLEDAPNTTETVIGLKWVNGDANAPTRIFVDGVLKKSHTNTTGLSGAESDVITGLAANTAYLVEIDHYENGVPDPTSSRPSVTITTDQPTLDVPTGFDARGANCETGDPMMEFTWFKGTNAGSAKYRIQRDAVSTFPSPTEVVLTSAGASSVTVETPTSGTFYHRIRAEQAGYVNSAWLDDEDSGGSPRTAEYGACEPSVPI